MSNITPLRTVSTVAIHAPLLNKSLHRLSTYPYCRRGEFAFLICLNNVKGPPSVTQQILYFVQCLLQTKRCEGPLSKLPGSR